MPVSCENSIYSPAVDKTTLLVRTSNQRMPGLPRTAVATDTNSMMCGDSLGESLMVNVAAGGSAVWAGSGIRATGYSIGGTKSIWISGGDFVAVLLSKFMFLSK